MIRKRNGWPVLVEAWGCSEIYHGLNRVVAAQRSHRGQEIAIVDMGRYGRALWIDGWPQFAMLDEHRYHQLLAFPALYHHPHPQDVLILGGGDYLAAWRVLMRRGIRRIKIADWDQAVSRLVLKHFPTIRALNVHLDPRVDFPEEVDIAQYLPTTDERFDIVIEDLTEPDTLERLVPGALGHIRRILKPGGALVAQAGELSLVKESLRGLAATVRCVRELFPNAWVYGYSIDSFVTTQAFVAAWRDCSVQPAAISSLDFSERFDAELVARDRPFYTPLIHQAAFTLDPAIQSAIWISSYE